MKGESFAIDPTTNPRPCTLLFPRLQQKIRPLDPVRLQKDPHRSRPRLPFHCYLRTREEAAEDRKYGERLGSVLLAKQIQHTLTPPHAHNAPSSCRDYPGATGVQGGAAQGNVAEAQAARHHAAAAAQRARRPEKCADGTNHAPQLPPDEGKEKRWLASKKQR